MPEREVTILALLKDKFSGPFAGINRGIKAFIAGVKKAGVVATKAFRGIFSILGRLKRSIISFRSLFAVAAFAGIIKVFKDFERGLANVATLVDTTAVSMATLQEAVIETSKATGESLDSLNKALFDTVSAGVEAEKAGAVLLTSSKLAQAGATTTAEATKGLVSVMNAYGLSVDDAGELSDAFFQAQKQGITTIGELSRSLGKLAPVARLAGLSIDEMLAAVATLTKSGLSTQEAVTSLRSIMAGFIKPTETASKTAKLLGIELNSASISGGKFVEKLKEISKKTGNNAEIMAKLFGNVRALAGIVNLTGEEAAEFNRILGTMADKAGSTEEAFGKVADTLDFKIAQLMANLKVLFIRIGEAAKPFIENVLERMTKFVDDLGNKQNQIRAVINQIVKGIKQVVKIAKSIWNENDTVRFVINVVTASITAGIRVVTAAIPVLLNLARQIGRQVGIALIDSLLGSSNEALARQLASGKRGAFRAGLKLFGFEESELQGLSAQGRALIQVEKNVALARAKIRAAEEAESRPTLGGLPSPLGPTPSVADAKAQLAREQKDLTRIQKDLAGSSLKDLGTADSAATRAAIQDFTAKIPGIAAQYGANLKTGLSPATQAAMDELGNVFGDGWTEAMRKAAEADEAERKALAEAAGRKAGEAIATGAGTGIQMDENAGGLNIGAAQEELTLKFDALTEAMGRYRTISQQIQENREGGFISGPEAAQQQADALKIVSDQIENINMRYAEFMEAAGTPELKNYVKNTFEEIIVGTQQFKDELTNEQLTGDILTGFEAGLTNTIEKLGDLRAAGLSAGQTLAGALGDGLIVALEKGGEAFKQFALGIVKQIAQMILKAMIYKAIMAGLGGGFNAGGAVGGVKLATGGPVPGPDVNRDVVPAVLTPGEFVQPRGVVEHYGLGIMEALRRQLIPKAALAGFGSSSPVPKGRFLQSGGQPTAVGPSQPTPAYIVADDDSMDRMLNGGQSAFFEFLRRNADTVSGLLRSDG